ncbi:hypothetical protein C6341_g3383 [Phytophthora cactorum]|nr:hypothetical protein C6341_g3383 [Phytophthora cactorum]
MHRAEKSSSKICRAREVEKAQELHRKKIDGVKSYVYGVISKPAASRSSTSFNLRPARSMMGSFSSITCVQGEPPLNASASTANSGSSAELGHQKNIQSGDSAGTIFAYHRELQCEYKLSITKEMTHELLDKSSSSSLAAETAAAAGTNLSMQEIARNICDHINFALLGADQGEMLDVDLFGQEVVVFPALERPSPADGNSEQPEKQSDEGASPEEHEQELSPRTTRWEEENISEGDEDAGSDGYDVEGLDAASNADSLPYNTDEEEPAKTKASHISYTNQDDVDLNESLGDPKTHHPKDEETPENEATSDLRQWRQGRKIDGRFCLLQGASDDTTLSYSIAALGQLEALPTG